MNDGKEPEKVFRSIPVKWAKELDADTTNPIYDANWNKMVSPERRLLDAGWVHVTFAGETYWEPPDGGWYSLQEALDRLEAKTEG